MEKQKEATNFKNSTLRIGLVTKVFFCIFLLFIVGLVDLKRLFHARIELYGMCYYLAQYTSMLILELFKHKLSTIERTWFKLDIYTADLSAFSVSKVIVHLVAWWALFMEQKWRNTRILCYMNTLCNVNIPSRTDRQYIHIGLNKYKTSKHVAQSSVPLRSSKE